MTGDIGRRDQQLQAIEDHSLAYIARTKRRNVGQPHADEPVLPTPASTLLPTPSIWAQRRAARLASSVSAPATAKAAIASALRKFAAALMANEAAKTVDGIISGRVEVEATRDRHAKARLVIKAEGGKIVK